MILHTDNDFRGDCDHYDNFEIKWSEKLSIIIDCLSKYFFCELLIYIVLLNSSNMCQVNTILKDLCVLYNGEHHMHTNRKLS